MQHPPGHRAVDALEKSGHLRRDPHPTDRRAHIVALTERGHHDADRVRHLRASTAQQLFDGVDPHDLDAFVRVADTSSHAPTRPPPAGGVTKMRGNAAVGGHMLR